MKNVCKGPSSPLFREQTCFPHVLFKTVANIAIILLGLVVLAGCSREENLKKPGKNKRAAIPVTTVVATTRTIPVELQATGHVEALHSVEIRSQVTGVLQSVHFAEGQEVKTGDMLFTIDPRPFAAELARADALLAKDKADLENARRDENRYTLAARKGLVSQEQVDTAMTRVATLNATIKADKAAVESARLNLDFCSIKAPFSGRTGELYSDQGNLIKANADNPMLTINSIDPILISFTVPGQHLLQITASQKQGPIPVLAEQDIGQPPVSGTLVFIDNMVAPTTGLIRLKAQFANDARFLWPGQLINVRLHLTDIIDALVVPSQALQVGQQGSYLFVVGPEQRVHYRQVTPGRRYRNYTVVEAGLKLGEKVVTDGQMLLEDGSLVAERTGTSVNLGSRQP